MNGFANRREFPPAFGCRPESTPGRRLVVLQLNCHAGGSGEWVRRVGRRCPAGDVQPSSFAASLQTDDRQGWGSQREIPSKENQGIFEV